MSMLWEPNEGTMTGPLNSGDISTRLARIAELARMNPERREGLTLNTGWALVVDVQYCCSIRPSTERSETFLKRGSRNVSESLDMRSRMREFRTFGSVGALGERSPGATRLSNSKQPDTSIG